MTTERDDYYEPAIAKTPAPHVDGRTILMNSEHQRLLRIEAAAAALIGPPGVVVMCNSDISKVHVPVYKFRELQTALAPVKP